MFNITERDFRKIQSTETCKNFATLRSRFFLENVLGKGPAFWIFYGSWIRAEHVAGFFHLRKNQTACNRLKVGEHVFDFKSFSYIFGHFLKIFPLGKQNSGFSNFEPIFESKDVKLFLTVAYDFEMFMRILTEKNQGRGVSARNFRVRGLDRVQPKLTGLKL